MGTNMHLVPEGDNPLHELYELARSGQSGLPATWFRINEESDILAVQHVGVIFYQSQAQENERLWVAFDSDAHPVHVARLVAFLTRHELSFNYGRLTMYGQFGEPLWADFEGGAMLFESHLTESRYLPILAQQGYRPIPYKDGTYRLIKI